MPCLTRRTVIAALSVSSLVTLMKGNVSAQEWPRRPVRFILPFGAGSSTAIAARLIADRLQTIWGQGIAVEPRPGGDGMIAVNGLLHAQDEYTFFFGASSTFIHHPYRYAKVSYDAGRDLRPIVMISSATMAFAAPTSIGLSSLDEFVAYTRKNAGKTNVAVATGASEIMFDGFIKKENLDVAKVPYKDIVQAVSDLAVGRLDALFGSLTIFQSQVQAGTVRVLSISGDRRLDVAPGIQTAHEQGYPYLGLEGAIGLVGSTATTPGLRDRIASDILKIVNEPAVAERLRSIGQEPRPGDANAFAAFIDAQIRTISEVASLTGIKPQ